MHLREPAHLFVEPDPDPFSAHAMYTSGIEHVLSQLRPLRVRGQVKLRVHMPSEVVTEELEHEIVPALLRYCRAMIDANRREVLSLRREGNRALFKGLTFLAVCVLLAFVVDKLPFVPEYWQWVISEGLFIGGWVALWRPIEIFLYEWWPYARENKLYQAILNAKVEILAEPDDSATPLSPPRGGNPAVG